MTTCAPAQFLRPFEEYAHNAHSQRGEDGILGEILHRLPRSVLSRTCLEFGASDGPTNSNTARLIEQCKFSGVMIEPDAAKFAALRAYWGSCTARATCICDSVWWGPAALREVLVAADSVDEQMILDLDVLSIDIDGNDIHAWLDIAPTAKVVVIEYNPTIPTEVNWAQPRDEAISQGASLLALVSAGRSLGYELVAVTRYNAIFIRADLFPYMRIADNSPWALRRDLSQVTYIWHGYDGSAHLCGAMAIPWHAVKLDVADVQTIPANLQAYPPNYTAEQLAGYRDWRAIREGRI